MKINKASTFILSLIISSSFNGVFSFTTPNSSRGTVRLELEEVCPSGRSSTALCAEPKPGSVWSLVDVMLKCK